MVTFKQFIAEDLTSTIIALKEPIAAALKLPRYKVNIHQMSTQKTPGFTEMVLNLSIPGEIDSELYAFLVSKLLKKHLHQLVPTATFIDHKISKWTGGSGQKIDTVYVYFNIPNAAIY